MGNLEGGNISEVTFYPSGALNITDKNKTHLLVMRYRLLSETEPLRGEIIPTPFGLGEPEDRISFTVHFISPTSIDFKYTAGGKTQTIYLKKVKEIAHGIVPLNS